MAAASGALVRGIREDDLAARSTIADNLRGGIRCDPEQRSNRDRVTRMALRLGLGLGDRLTLISPKGNRHGIRHGAQNAGLRDRRDLSRSACSTTTTA